ncbi:MAG: ATP-binding protein [Methanoregula sp.]|jgi:SpoVK/Ycf46/Vps4 family AAA+-type ATPase|uniref:ATP-binding protein n=1 Tax=Methanoregula sp. TaxID=2052170 RepID=UPI003D0EA0B5
MTSDEFKTNITNLPDCAQNFLISLDSRLNISEPSLFERNFPDGRYPHWMRSGHGERNSKVPKWIDSFFSHSDKQLQKLWIEHGFLKEDPTWLQKLLELESARVSRVFTVTGNINDYCFDPDEGYMPVIDRLEKSAVTRKDWVIRYSLSNRFSVKSACSNTIQDDDTANNPLTENSVCLDPKPNLLETLREDFQGMERLLRRNYNGGICIIFENLHMVLPPESRDVERNVLTDAILRWAQAPWMYQSKNLVILLAESSDALNSELRTRGSQVESIEIPRPDSAADRLKFLTSVFSGSRVTPMLKIRLDHTIRPRFSESEFGNEVSTQLMRLADRTSGLNYVGLENLILHVNILDDRTLTGDFIKDQKREILIQESSGLLVVTEPESNSESRSNAFKQVGGLKKITDRLLMISQMMDTKAGSTPIRHVIPKGLLFLGPPGTGKTLVARSFASACGINFAELGDLRDMWVGQSERNLSRVLSLIRSLRPVVVFIDEIDQSEGSRGESGDSGVGKRIFSKLLQFMSDPELEGEVLWIGASNRPDLIDSALKRAGRFDLVIPFFLPEPEARKQIFAIQFRRRHVEVDLSENDWEKIMEWSEGFTGAEIEALVKESTFRKIVNNPGNLSPTMTLVDIKVGFDVYRPPANRDDYEKMILLAVREVTFLDMLPEKYRKIREEMKFSGPSH